MIVRGVFGVLVLTTAGTALWYWNKRKGRRRAKANLRRSVDRLVARQLPCLGERKLLGVGNVGAVFDATLGPGWEEQLGIRWKSARPASGRVAVKLAAFKGKESKRAGVLVEFARRLDAAMERADPPPVCPFLAIGLVEDAETDSQYVVEVMPLVEGEGLDTILARGTIDKSRARSELTQILGTVGLLESMGYYSRNLDAENVIVRRDGSWLRIDFDNVNLVNSFPLERMKRLVRLARRVLEAIGDPRDAVLLATLRTTEAAPLDNWEAEGIPGNAAETTIATPGQLIGRIDRPQ